MLANNEWYGRGLRVLRMVIAVVAALMEVPAAAQVPATLTLEDAIELARSYNPGFRIQSNTASNADWNVRTAYGAFLPTASVSNSFSYQSSGAPVFTGGVTGADLGISTTPAFYSSSYSINLSMGLSGQDIFRVSQTRAQRNAVDARIDAAAYTLATNVTRQYLATLRARDGVEIARSALESADQASRLAEARFNVGEAPRMDMSQASVDRGRAEVNLVRAENAYETAKIALLELIGVELSQEFELVSTFEVFEPTWTEAELREQAYTSHPQLASVRADESAARAQSRSAWTTYLPSLSFTAGWSGFVRKTTPDEVLIAQAMGSHASQVQSCERWNLINAGLTTPVPDLTQDCSRFEFTDADAAEVVAANQGFPFAYDKNPPSIRASISFPLFNGFSREAQLQSARIAVRDAEERRRAEELRRGADVATSLLALRAAYRTVMLEERNAAASAEQLELAQQRYTLGAGSILELTQAQEQKTRADQANLDAIYTFHETLAALEAAVGRPLREDQGGL